MQLLETVSSDNPIFGRSRSRDETFDCSFSRLMKDNSDLNIQYYDPLICSSDVQSVSNSSLL